MVRAYSDEDYSCSHSTMLVTDSWEHARPVRDDEIEDDVSPWLLGGEGGTFVLAGHGWLQCTAESDEFHRVRLELHDSPPPLDLTGWGDVAETPYGSGSGWVGTGTLFGEEDDAHLELAGRGMYRVRASRRNAEDSGDEFLFQFWPVPGGDRAGPCYLARDPGEWSAYWRSGTDGTDFVGADLRAVLWWTGTGSGRFSVRQLAAITLLPEEDVGAALRGEAAGRRVVIDGDPGDPAAVLGLRLIGTVSRFEPDPDEEASGFWDGDPDDPDSRYWTPEETAQEFAQHDPDGPWGAGDPSPDPARFPTAPESEPSLDDEFEAIVAAYRAEHGEIPEGVAVAVSRWERGDPRDVPYLPPWGPPPAAGFVSGDGKVVTWEAGRPRVLADLGRRRGVRSAHETLAGVVVLTGRGEAMLVRPDGTLDVLEAAKVDAVAVDPAGSDLALLVHHDGRRPWTVLHWLDLLTGTRRSWTWAASGDWLDLVGVHGGAMLLNSHLEENHGAPTTRWVPGSPPERMAWHVAAVDPHSGQMCVWDAGRMALVGPRANRPLGPGDPSALAPGARLVYGVGEHRLTVVGPAGDDVRAIAFPHNAWLYDSIAWEGPHTLVVPMRDRDDLECDAVRIDAVDGTYERIDLGEHAGHHPGPVLVRPLIR